MNETTKEAAIRWVDEINALYDLVASKVGNDFQEAGFLPVGEEVAKRIRTSTSLDVTGYEHIIDNSSLRHILRHHGTSAEYKRGQVPITKQDFNLLLYLLLDPDTIEYAGRTKQGRDVLRYSKTMGESVIFYTEEMRTKKSRLAAVTLYKRIYTKG